MTFFMTEPKFSSSYDRILTIVYYEIKLFNNSVAKQTSSIMKISDKSINTNTPLKLIRVSEGGYQRKDLFRT